MFATLFLGAFCLAYAPVTLTLYWRARASQPARAVPFPNVLAAVGVGLVVGVVLGVGVASEVPAWPDNVLVPGAAGFALGMLVAGMSLDTFTDPLPSVPRPTGDAARPE